MRPYRRGVMRMLMLLTMELFKCMMIPNAVLGYSEFC